MIARLSVYSAYYLKSSPHYQRCKKFVYDLLENPHSRLKSWFDLFMICLVVSSVSMLVYQVEHQTGRWGDYLEHAVVSVFIGEYLLRLWLSSNSHLIIIKHYEKSEYLNIAFKLKNPIREILTQKIHYIFSPFALIDLLAILPSYRPLRILRVFLIFRLFKLFRYSNSIKVFSDVLASKRFELITLMVFLGFLVFISSIAIYLFENPLAGGNIHDLYDAMYWSIVTISTVGYGDITPQTLGGRTVTLILILTGLGVLAFFTSIIVAAFNDKMHSLRENRTYAELDRYKNFIIICGFGRVGQEIAQQFIQDKQKFVVIDQNEVYINTAKRQGILAIEGNVTQNEVLLNAGIKRGATAVLCVTGNDVTNVYVTLSSRHLNPTINIISRANRHDNVKKMHQAGADHVIEPFAIAGLLAAEYIGQPVAFEALSGILQEQKDILLETISVPEKCMLQNKQIGDIDFIAYKLTLVGVVSTHTKHLHHKNKYQLKKQHFYFNPDLHFHLQAGDMLIVLGREYSISHLRDQIEQSKLIR